MTIRDREWTTEQLQRINDLLEAIGPVADRLSQMTSREVAELVINHVWDDFGVTTPQNALIGEVIERLLIQDDFVRGNQEAPYEDA